MRKINFDLITKVLDISHVLILNDWLAFLQQPPTSIVIYTDISHLTIASKINYSKNDTSLLLENSLFNDDIMNKETLILERLVQKCPSKIFVTVNLDTLPFTTDKNWLQLQLNNILDEKYLFMTGCGLIFRKDKIINNTNCLMTQRFSNNFALVNKKFWLHAINSYSGQKLDSATSRFYSEWAIEQLCLDDNLYGVRRLDSDVWRVFHVQQWGPLLFTIRRRFLKGEKIENYMNRIDEDYLHPWQKYYLYPKPNFVKIIRVWIGRYRRSILNNN